MTGSVIAKALGISKRTLREWAVQDRAVRVDTGSYLFWSTIIANKRYELEQKSALLEEARETMAAKRREIKELKANQELGLF